MPIAPAAVDGDQLSLKLPNNYSLDVEWRHVHDRVERFAYAPRKWPTVGEGQRVWARWRARPDYATLGVEYELFAGHVERIRRRRIFVKFDDEAADEHATPHELDRKDVCLFRMGRS